VSGTTETSNKTSFQSSVADTLCLYFTVGFRRSYVIRRSRFLSPAQLVYGGKLKRL